MTAKEYLQQIKKDDIRINQLVKEVDDLRRRTVFISGIDYSKDRVQTSSDGMTGAMKAIEKFYDAEIRLNKMIDRFIEEKEKIVSQIQMLSKSDYIEILYLRYVNYMSFEEIACKQAWSYSWTIHRHGEALQEFYKKFIKTA